MQASASQNLLTTGSLQGSPISGQVSMLPGLVVISEAFWSLTAFMPASSKAGVRLFVLSTHKPSTLLTTRDLADSVTHDTSALLTTGRLKGYTDFFWQVLAKCPNPPQLKQGPRTRGLNCPWGGTAVWAGWGSLLPVGPPVSFQLRFLFAPAPPLRLRLLAARSASLSAFSKRFSSSESSARGWLS